MGVSVRPQPDLRTVQDELVKTATVATIHDGIVLVARMCAGTAGSMMPHVNHAITAVTLLSAIVNDMSDVVFHLVVIITGILGQESPVATGMTFGRVFHSTEIIHHARYGMQGQGIAVIEVRPQGTANEGIVIDDPGLLFQEIHIVASCQLQHVTDDVMGLAEVSVIVLVIAHDHHSVRESITTPLEEVTHATAP